jgi:hypothetical protein
VILIQQGARHRHLRVFEHRILPRFLLLEPAPDALPFGHPCAGHHVVGKAVLRMGASSGRIVIATDDPRCRED